MKKNEKASSYDLTMDYGLHHGQSVEGSISMMFCSCYLPWACDFGVFVGIQITLNYGRLSGKIIQKPAKHKKEPYPSVNP